MGKQRVHGGHDASRHHRAEQVLNCVAVYLRVGAPQKVYEGIPKKIRADGIYCRSYKAAPESEACGVPCPVHVFVAQCPGNHACAAYAEEIGYSGKEHKGGHAYRHGGNHGVAAGEANEKVSAMLYITSIIWPITAGMARESMASAIGASSKRCFSLLRPFMLLSFYIREKPSTPNLFLLQVHDRRLMHLLAME